MLCHYHISFFVDEDLLVDSWMDLGSNRCATVVGSSKATARRRRLALI